MFSKTNSRPVGSAVVTNILQGNDYHFLSVKIDLFYSRSSEGGLRGKYCIFHLHEIFDIKITELG